jgi:hypothetical protein
MNEIRVKGTIPRVFNGMFESDRNYKGGDIAEIELDLSESDLRKAIQMYSDAISDITTDYRLGKIGIDERLRLWEEIENKSMKEIRSLLQGTGKEQQEELKKYDPPKVEDKKIPITWHKIGCECDWCKIAKEEAKVAKPEKSCPECIEEGKNKCFEQLKPKEQQMEIDWNGHKLCRPIFSGCGEMFLDSIQTNHNELVDLVHTLYDEVKEIRHLTGV